MSLPIRRCCVAVLVALWLWSIALPVAYVPGQKPPLIDGGYMLGAAYMGAFIGQFGWFANLTFWAIAIGLMRRRPWGSRWMTIYGVVTLGLVVNSLFWRHVPSNTGDDPVQAYLAGYWLWLVTVFAAGSWALLSGQRVFKSAARG